MTAPERHCVSRILIVDDEPAVLDALAALLVDEGHSVQTAPDGHAALQLIHNAAPDLLITDVMMPGLDGWALLAQARLRAPTLPVIVMSAVHRLQAPQRDLLTADHTVFLQKPFDIETLLDLIARIPNLSPS